MARALKRSHRETTAVVPLGAALLLGAGGLDIALQSLAWLPRAMALPVR